MRSRAAATADMATHAAPAPPHSPPPAARPAVRPWRTGRLARAAVPLLFFALCLLGTMAAQITPEFLLRELLARFARNAILVLSLLVPILAGLGLNFGIVIGAMAGQVAAILVTYWGARGFAGFALACALAVPIAVLFGTLTGLLFNRAK